VLDVLFHPEAQAEYEVSRDWYLVRSEQAATRFEIAVEHALDTIAGNPEFYPQYDELHRFAVLRRFPFSIVYQILPEGIYIVAVAHSSRPPGYWQDRIS
jgi:plasmid stabilization system protein ParE